MLLGCNRGIGELNKAAAELRHYFFLIPIAVDLLGNWVVRCVPVPETCRKGRYSHSLVVCWRTVCADAKLGRQRLHDLRHTAASQAVMSGENLSLVGRLLGHRRHRTTVGYAHLADGHLVEAAERVGRIIAEAMEGEHGG